MGAFFIGVASLRIWHRLSRSVALRDVAGLCVVIAVAGCAADPDRAIEHQDAVARDPAAMMRIAEAAEHGGDMSGAEAFYSRAAELQPSSSAAQIGIARSLASRGDVKEAIAKLQAAHARNPNDAEIAGTLGRLLVAAKDPDGALAVFDEGLRATPRSSSLLVGRGVALDALDRHQDAQAAYREALEINPASAPAKQDLALSQELERGPRRSPRSDHD